MEKLVIIPTYNERENIPSLLDQLMALPHGLDVLVVDDASPDGTAALVEERMARRWSRGHYLMLEKPDEFAERLEEALGLLDDPFAGVTSERQRGRTLSSRGVLRRTPLEPPRRSTGVNPAPRHRRPRPISGWSWPNCWSCSSPPVPAALPCAGWVNRRWWGRCWPGCCSVPRF